MNGGTHHKTTTFYRHHIYTFIPKQSHKRTKSAPRRKSTRTSPKKATRAPKSQPSTRKRQPALSRQERKKQGLCSCGRAAIQGQTRCEKCAATHRESNRLTSEKRRRASGMKPRPQISVESIEQIREEIAAQDTRGASMTRKRVRSEQCEKNRRQHRAQVRAERISLGLCVRCGKPGLVGRTRCADCALQHRQADLRSRVKAKLISEQYRQQRDAATRPLRHVPDFSRRATDMDAGVVSSGYNTAIQPANLHFDHVQCVRSTEKP